MKSYKVTGEKKSQLLISMIGSSNIIVMFGFERLDISIMFYPKRLDISIMLYLILKGLISHLCLVLNGENFLLCLILMTSLNFVNTFLRVFRHYFLGISF